MNEEFDKRIYIPAAALEKMYETLKTGAAMVVPFNRDNNIMAQSAIELMQDSLNAVIAELGDILGVVND